MALSAVQNRKLISIVMATYNCGQKVENTLKSIFSQNRDLFELIVIDNVSTDDTLEYIKKYENDLTLISEKDAGVYYAFNKGLDLAAGNYIYFIGAGDCLKPEILEQIKDFLPPDAPSLVYGTCYFVKQKVYNGKEFTDTLFIRDNLCQQGIFYHRDVFDIVGKFDLRYKVLADWFLNLKCFMRQEINKRYIPFVIADYEEGGLSSGIDCDPVFKKEFPLFVKERFGVSKYLMCRAYLKNPAVFNHLYFSEYYGLLGYFIYKFPRLKRLAHTVKPYVYGRENPKKDD